MGHRTPIDRYDLNIKKSDYVLEVGSGHNPSYRANVIVRNTSARTITEVER